MGQEALYSYIGSKYPGLIEKIGIRKDDTIDSMLENYVEHEQELDRQPPTKRHKAKPTNESNENLGVKTKEHSKELVVVQGLGNYN